MSGSMLARDEDRVQRFSDGTGFVGVCLTIVNGRERRASLK